MFTHGSRMQGRYTPGFGVWTLRGEPNPDGPPRMEFEDHMNLEWDGNEEGEPVFDMTHCPEGRHQWVNYDDGDAENGPCVPDVACVKCGISIYYAN